MHGPGDSYGAEGEGSEGEDAQELLKILKRLAEILAAVLRCF